MGFVFTLGFVGIIIIIALILAALVIAGVILIIIYAVLSSKRKAENKKAGKGLFVASMICFSPAALIAVSFVVSVAINAFHNVTASNFRERWINSNSWITDTSAQSEALEGFFEAADKGDKEAVKALYAYDIQINNALDKQVDDFLKDYPGGFSGLEVDFKGGMSDGMDPAYISKSAEVVKDGVTYFIHISACYKNSENPRKVGLEYISLKTKQGMISECDSDFSIDTDYHFIHSSVMNGEDFEIREIQNHEYRYKEYDRQLTLQQVQEAVDNSFDMEELIQKIGKPNADCKRDRTAVYELANGEESNYALVIYGGFEHIDNVRFIDE